MSTEKKRFFNPQHPSVDSAQCDWGLKVEILRKGRETQQIQEYSRIFKGKVGKTLGSKEVS